METANRFFRKYFLTGVGLIALFILVNLVLLAGVLIFSSLQSSRPTLRMESLAAMLSVDGDGTICADENIGAALAERKMPWAMVLDADGKVVWGSGLPDELPRQYTAADIARFTRWYLQDWPVVVWVVGDQGHLLVAACEKGSLFRTDGMWDYGQFRALCAGIVCALIANMTLVVALFWRSTRKLEHAVAPVLAGIETLAAGRAPALPEQGELAAVNATLNHAGAKLCRKERARAAWINGISHDVRTPLALMLGYAAGLEDDAALPPAARAQAGIIRRQGEKLRQLIGDLNLTTKLEYAMQPLNRQAIEPVELARTVVSDFLNNGLNGAYTLTLEEDGPLPPLRADSALLARALGNLVQNSITHNPGGCQITVAVRPAGGGCAFCVADDGVGPAADAPARWNAGQFEAAATGSDGQSPHGFGLRLVWQIAHAHGGQVHFTAAAPHGLLVELILPGKGKDDGRLLPAQ